MESSDNNSSSLPNIKLQEKFVQDLNGTTMSEVVLLSLQFPGLAFVALSVELFILNRFNVCNFKVAPNSLLTGALVLMLEVITIVLPVMLILTLLSDFVHIVFLFIISLIIFIITLSVSFVDNHVLYWKTPNFKQALLSESSILVKQPFITYFRSFVFLVTALSILGVDFHIYPRRFAKTETYGVSIMDVGVGLFIISNTLVQGNSSGKELKKSLIASFVLTILGVLRYVLVQRFDYQMHVTEYGLHWNFFITLAFVKLLSTLLLKIFRGYSLCCGIVLMLVHQYFLSHSLESVVLSINDRGDWFNANREGIVSLSGYLSLYMIGIGVANFTDTQNKHLTYFNKLKTMLLLSTASICLFGILFYFDNIDFKVSRRLANLPYILWILGISFELLAMFILVEFLSLWFLPIHPQFKSKLYYLLTPVLLESINFNGLPFFLLANLLTGLINIYMDVINYGVLFSILILSIYMIINCAVVFSLYVLNIRIKL